MFCDNWLTLENHKREIVVQLLNINIIEILTSILILLNFNTI